MRWKTVSIVALLAAPLLLGIATTGIGTLPVTLAIVSGPIGLALLIRRWPTPIFIGSALALVLSGSVGVLVAHAASPLRVPLEGWLASLCGALGVLGVGHYVAQQWRRSLLRWSVVVSVVTVIALAAEGALATSTAPDAWPPAISALEVSLLVGIPYALISLISAILGTAERDRLPYGFLIGAAVLSVWCAGVFSSLFSVPHASFSRLSVSTYRLDLTFDRSQEVFVANEWMTAKFQWADDGDVARSTSGDFLPWSEQQRIQDDLRVASLLSGYEVARSELRKVGSDGERDLLEGVLQLKRTRQLAKHKRGALSYVSEIELPALLGLGPAVIAPAGETRIEIDVEVPDYFGLSHNLDGTLQPTVLPNGDTGQILHASKVNDLWGVVRLRYPIAALRNPVFAKVAEFSWWTVALSLLSLLCGVITYLAGVVLDVIKDERIKPVAVRLLSRLKLIRGTGTTRQDTDSDSLGY